MKCCEYESALRPSRMRFGVCDAHSDRSELLERRTGGERSDGKVALIWRPDRLDEERTAGLSSKVSDLK